VPGVVRFARMAGSSIAAPGAAAWVTDFLNAAYYARPDGDRDVADLRLAHGILTTRWARKGRGRLGAVDLAPLHQAFGGLRLRRGGRLEEEALLEGASRLIGDWFPDAWTDDGRRAHGIAFPTVDEREAFEPERRLRRSAIGPLTPPLREPAEQHWATYDPVQLPDPEGALAFLLEPGRWPDMGAAAGRFTALRGTGLEGQTFEIEVVAEPTPRSPVFTRGYVTCTALHTGDGLADAVADLTARYRAGAGADARSVLPEGGEPLALVVLTTHAGHFLGRALSQLLVWREANGTWIRDVGAWDPLPLHLAATYNAAGKAAQHAFWGPAEPARSMLAQLALVSAVRR
jgi:hypothetical protein